MEKTLFFVFIVVLTIICPVFAAEWVQVGEKNYFDVSSLAPYEYNYSDVVYSIWEKNLNDGAGNWRTLEKHLGKKLWYDKVKLVINCTKKEIGIKSVVYYDLGDNAVDSDEYHYLNWFSVVPETNGELIYTLVCSAVTTNVQDSAKKTIQTPTSAKIKIKYHKK